MREYSKRVHYLADGLRKNAGLIEQLVAEKVHGALILGTPVGGPPTSPHDPHPRLARSNWLVSIGPSADLSERPPRTENEAVNEGINVIARVRHDQEVVVANGGAKVPYLGLLNQGWSAQAPAGFVKLAALAGIRALKGTTILSPPKQGGVRLT